MLTMLGNITVKAVFTREIAQRRRRLNHKGNWGQFGTPFFMQNAECIIVGAPIGRPLNEKLYYTAEYFCDFFNAFIPKKGVTTVKEC